MSKKKKYFRNKNIIGDNVEPDCLWRLSHDGYMLLVDEDEFLQLPYVGNEDKFYEIDDPFSSDKKK